MHPEIVLGSLNLSSYWLFYHLGFIAALGYGGWAAIHKEEIPALETILFFSLLYFVQVVTGGLLSSFDYWRETGVIPFHINPWQTGRSFHFILFFSLVLLYAYFRVTGRWRLRFLDYFAISAAIMSPLQRMGCFLAGCCRGKVCDLPWAIRFPKSEMLVHPAQLYHVVFEGLILLPFLLWLLPRRRFEGQVLAVYILLYSLFRLAVEMVRDNPPFVWGLSFAQIISGPMALAAAWVLIHQLRKTRQPENSPVKGV